ncbi:unnamed protein product [Medioppia subpectinata]|uniref:Neurotransmitter-gated ion-channel ligand-binding domain-containing protein n=1 Tax=Medioppia subpectinata TaxID=1979941 RepID=A0A7R9KPS7_9ACAR|nr:unnamed protein product [Medioppia subpectinata]CAG2106154.1 unnamed protein product [Medioppia subpectinata]
MFVIDYTFDPIKREMNANMYFRQKWNDPRLVSQAITADIVGGESLANRVWTPDTFFANSMAVNVMKYPSRNSFLMVNTKGDVYYSERLQIQFRCGAKVSTKNDECNLELESYGFSMEMSFIAFFRQKWNDPRLVSQAITADVVGGQSLVDRVWIPDTFFVNSIDVDIFKYPIRNSFIKVKPNGDVLYSERIEVEFLCNSYKMQTNETVDCYLVMESSNYSRLEANFKLTCDECVENL